jgi:hypothetical protein
MSWMRSGEMSRISAATSTNELLTPEMQAHLMILSDKEVQNGRDIREGLLATLHGYQGFAKIKKLFEQAIRCVQFE